MSKSNENHHALYLAGVAAFPQKTKQVIQRETNVLWSEIKKKEKNYEEELKKLQTRSTTKKAAMFKYFTTRPNPTKKPEQEPTTSEEIQIVPHSNSSGSERSTNSSDTSNISDESTDTRSSTSSVRNAAPVQEKIRSSQSDVDSKISDMMVVERAVGLTPPMKKTMEKLMQEKKTLENKLRRAKQNQKAQLNFRDRKRKAMTDLNQSHPEAAKRLRIHGSAGRPPLESQPEMVGLHSAILDIVIPQSSADDRRRTEVYNCCQNLDSLREKLAERGFNLTRTATYYRLIPANVHHRDGKRHVHTVPVKLKRAQNSRRKIHEDRSFARAMVAQVEEFASLFSSSTACFISQDDKARVPLGLPISKKQTAMVMHLDYQVTLPDHDFPIGEKHKLIPSVYAACLMKDGKVGFNGPTYMAIRSAKHDGSTAKTHAADFVRLTELESFKSALLTNSGEVKPLLFVGVDGGPDEAPGNSKSLLAWYNCFERHGLDAIYVFCNAPGLSAYNKVERRMAPLSKDTSGIILPFDTFGSHLNASNKTIDIDLEKKNFKAAGEILASVWSETVIDGHPVYAEFRPAGSELEFLVKPQRWIDVHVRQSKYLLQVVKCNDTSCCAAKRVDFEKIIGGRFLPPPIPLKTTTGGPTINQEGSFGSLFQNVWLSKLSKTKVQDTHCPTRLKIKHKSGLTELARRTCSSCGIYYPTLVALKAHAPVCSGEDLSGSDMEEESENPDEFTFEDQLSVATVDV